VSHVKYTLTQIDALSLAFKAFQMNSSTFENPIISLLVIEIALQMVVMPNLLFDALSTPLYTTKARIH